MTRPVQEPGSGKPGSAGHGRRKRAVALLTLGLAVPLALDLSRPPADQLTARALDAAIVVYQRALSPAFHVIGVRCRFSPTCSEYGRACVQRFGAARGSWLAVRRVLRCGPWTAPGTHDPPPEVRPPSLARHPRGQ